MYKGCTKLDRQIIYKGFKR